MTGEELEVASALEDGFNLSEVKWMEFAGAWPGVEGSRVGWSGSPRETCSKRSPGWASLCVADWKVRLAGDRFPTR